jgi:phosphopantothenoylcysteine decarboxylase/phosphopantothenate--cysteine ligase
LEPEDIFSAVEQRLLAGNDKPLAGKKVLLTAGPTQERLDPVRFITNRSTGKMGYALAKAAMSLGAEVRLISGPTALADPVGVEVDRVDSAEAMYQAVHRHQAACDIIIMSAGVADYRPAHFSDKKIKKKDDDMHLAMERTSDILASVGAQKRPDQFLVGFALETDNPMANAQSKLDRKNLDLIVLNSLQDKGAGFGHDTNRVTLIPKQGQPQALPLKDKTSLAHDILRLVVSMLV